MQFSKGFKIKVACASILTGYLAPVTLDINTRPLEAFASYSKTRIIASTLDNPSMRLVDDVCPKYGVRKQFGRAEAFIESAGGTQLIARETSKYWKRDIEKYKLAKPGTARHAELLSSYGVFGISGLYAYLEYGIEPADLFDDVTNVNLGCAKLRKNLDECRSYSKSLYMREFCAAAKHNGGSKGYRNPQALRYAKKVMAMASSPTSTNERS